MTLFAALQTIATFQTMAGIAVVCLVVLGILAWAHTPTCPECGHCQRAKAERERKQKELNHDYAHKGNGFLDTTPDWFECHDEKCPRNEAVRERRLAELQKPRSQRTHDLGAGARQRGGGPPRRRS